MKKIKKTINAAILSKKPKTPAVSPAFAVASCPSFKRDLAKIIPRIEKGIEKEVRKTPPTPNQKGREIIILANPNMRLKIPLNLEIPLILFPPSWKSPYTLIVAS